VCFDRETGEEVCLYNYDGESLTAGKSAQKIGDKYYINGEESTDIDYLSAQTAIMLNQDVTRIQNSGYVSLEDYKEYIMSYENEFEGAAGESADENADENSDENADETADETSDEGSDETTDETTETADGQ
jgi:hypothetical protein